MFIGLGLGMWFQRSTTLAELISELFASGEQGFIYDPSDFTTLFQDSAGTTPVTAAGDPVGKMLDKSGRGNHATQATAINRPILRIDGNGKYYLEANGTNSIMVIPVFTPASGILALVVGVTSGGSSGTIIASILNTFPNVRKFYLSKQTDKFAFTHTSDAGAASSCRADSVYPSASKHVVSTYSDYAQVAVADELKMTVDAGAIALTYIDANISAGNYIITTQMSLFAYDTVPVAFYAGNFYGAVGRFAATSVSQRATMEAYMNSKTGAY